MPAALGAPRAAIGEPAGADVSPITMLWLQLRSGAARATRAARAARPQRARAELAFGYVIRTRPSTSVTLRVTQHIAPQGNRCIINALAQSVS